jgi:hypothetical protein
VARSTDIAGLLGLIFVAACGSGPSKTQALETIQRDVKEDGSCTLPVELLGQVKKQLASKGLCVTLEGAPRAAACMDALAAAGVTTQQPASYMVDWTDEGRMPGVSPYDKKARNLVFRSCFEMTASLRDGRFACADARAEKVLKITKLDDTRSEVRYARTLVNQPAYANIEKACGQLAPPPAEATVTLVKDEKSGWSLAPAPSDATP